MAKRRYHEVYLNKAIKAAFDKVENPAISKEDFNKIVDDVIKFFKDNKSHEEIEKRIPIIASLGNGSNSFLDQVMTNYESYRGQTYNKDVATSSIQNAKPSVSIEDEVTQTSNRNKAQTWNPSFNDQDIKNISKLSDKRIESIEKELRNRPHNSSSSLAGDMSFAIQNEREKRQVKSDLAKLEQTIKGIRRKLQIDSLKKVFAIGGMDADQRGQFTKKITELNKEFTNKSEKFVKDFLDPTIFPSQSRIEAERQIHSSKTREAAKDDRSI